jgi:uncharacterized protein YggE
VRKILVAVGIGLATLAAQEPVRVFGPFVRATGESTINAKPDQAVISIGVVTQAPTAGAAASQNAAQVSAVIDRIKKELGGNGDLRTVGYSLNPNYSYPNPPSNTPPKIVGYNASNTVQAKIDDIALVGRIIDAATATGANHVNGIQFLLKDEQSARREALREAARNARASADALASALSLRVVRVHSAETGEPSMIRPMQEMPMARMAAVQAAPTPVEPGNIQVHATVTVTLEVASQ